MSTGRDVEPWQQASRAEYATGCPKPTTETGWQARKRRPRKLDAVSASIAAASDPFLSLILAREQFNTLPATLPPSLLAPLQPPPPLLPPQLVRLRRSLTCRQLLDNCNSPTFLGPSLHHCSFHHRTQPPRTSSLCRTRATTTNSPSTLSRRKSCHPSRQPCSLRAPLRAVRCRPSGRGADGGSARCARFDGEPDSLDRVRNVRCLATAPGRLAPHRTAQPPRTLQFTR